MDDFLSDYCDVFPESVIPSEIRTEIVGAEIQLLSECALDRGGWISYDDWKEEENLKKREAADLEAVRVRESEKARRIEEMKSDALLEARWTDLLCGGLFGRSSVVLQRHLLAVRAQRRVRDRRKRRWRRLAALRELYETEEIYVTRLRECKMVFVAGVADLVQNGQVSMADYSKLFESGYLALQPIHENLLSKLLPCLYPDGDENPLNPFSTPARDFLVDWVPQLRAYSPFLAALNEIHETWSSIAGDASLAPEVMRMESDPRTIRLGFASYMISSVNRMPRYRLLLLDLRKYTEPEHPDFPSIEIACDKVSEAMDFIDSSTTRIADEKQLIRIREHFRPNETVETLFVRRRQLVKNGDFRLSRVSGDHGFELTSASLEVFLFNDVVVFANSPRGELIYADHWNLEEVCLQVNPKSFPLSFRIALKEKEIVFRCADLGHWMNWLGALGSTIETCKVSLV